MDTLHGQKLNSRTECFESVTTAGSAVPGPAEAALNPLHDMRVNDAIFYGNEMYASDHSLCIKLWLLQRAMAYPLSHVRYFVAGCCIFC